MNRVTNEHLEQWLKWLLGDEEEGLDPDPDEAARAMQHMLDTGGVDPDPTLRRSYYVLLDPAEYFQEEATLEVKLTDEGIIADVWVPPDACKTCVASFAVMAQDVVDDHCTKMPDVYKPGLVSTCWAEVSLGDTVYVDNYQDGVFPNANPKVSGPFVVVKGNGCGRCLQSRRGTFMHYPNNLLKPEGT